MAALRVGKESGFRLPPRAIRPALARRNSERAWAPARRTTGRAGAGSAREGQGRVRSSLWGSYRARSASAAGS